MLGRPFDALGGVGAGDDGWNPGPESLGVSRYVYVGKTDEAAWEECAEHVVAVFHAQGQSGGPKFEPGRHTERSFAYKANAHIHVPRYSEVDFDQLDRDGYVIIGSPDTVTRKIKEQEAALGAGIFVPYIPFGAMRPADAMKSVELFGKEVLPNVR